MNEEKISLNIQNSISPPSDKNGEKYSLIIRISLYLLFFLTPIFFLPLTASPVGLNKQVLALILVLIAWIAFLIRSINLGEITYPKSLVNFAVLLFILSLAVSAFFSSSYIFSIQGQGGEPDTAVSFLIFILALFLSAAFFKQKDVLRAILLFFISFFILVIFNFFQIFGKFLLPFDFSRVAGFNPVGSVNGLGFFLALGLVMLIAVLDTLSFNKYLKGLMFALGIAILVTLLLINFWLIWLSLAIAMLVIMALKYVKLREIIFSKFSLTMIILALSLILTFIRLPIALVANLPVEVSPSYQGSFEIIKQTAQFPRVLFGSGPSTFSFEYGKYRSQALNQTGFWNVKFNQAVSAFSTNIVNFGILGTVALLFLFFSFIWTGLKLFLNDLKQKQDLGLFLALFSGTLFLIIIWFLYPANFTLSLFTFLGMGAGLSFLNTADAREQTQRKISLFTSPQRGLSLFLILIILTVFSAAIFYLTVQKYVGALYFAKSTAIGEQPLDLRIERAARAINLDNWRDDYLRALSQLYVLKLTQIRNSANFQEEFRNIVSNAIFLAQRATQINPSDSLNWTNLGFIYESVIFNAQGAEQFAQDAYNKAVLLEPSNPRMLVDISRVYLLSSDKAQIDLNALSGGENPDREKERELKGQVSANLILAKETLDRAFSLKNDFTPMLFLMAQIAEREGNLKTAIDKILISRNLNPQDSAIAFQLGLLYYKDNQTGAAQQEFERAVSLNENYSNARYFLGLIYDQKNQKQKALGEFEKIGALNPDNQEVKQIIDNLKSGKRALEGIVPPQTPPQERTETPVKE